MTTTPTPIRDAYDAANAAYAAALAAADDWDDDEAAAAAYRAANDAYKAELARINRECPA